MVVAQYSLARSGFEVYTTEEEKSETITSTVGGDKKDDSSTSDDNNDGFKLLNGEIKEIDYYADMLDNSFEEDYEDISSSGSVSFPSVEQSKIYKGKKICLKKEWETTSKALTWKDLKTVLLGFITEQTYSQDQVDLKLVGMHKLLEQKASFDFHQMKRSEIIKAIIEESGLKAKVDVTGLKDEVIDYSNKSSDNSGKDSGLAGGEGEEIDSLVASICKGVTGDLNKCKAIHSWLQKNVKYVYYTCSKYHSPEECLKHKSALNCADTARLTRAMMASAGLNCYVVHGPNHFWTMIEIDGKTYASDQTGSGSPFNTVWWQGRGRGTAIPPHSKNGNNPSC